MGYDDHYLLMNFLTKIEILKEMFAPLFNLNTNLEVQKFLPINLLF